MGVVEYGVEMMNDRVEKADLGGSRVCIRIFSLLSLSHCVISAIRVSGIRMYMYNTE